MKLNGVDHADESGTDQKQKSPLCVRKKIAVATTFIPRRNG